MLNEKIFREYDIRGVAGEEITRDTAFLVGKASGSLLKQAYPEAKRVSVGRDVRISSGDLASGVIKGLASAGLDVYNVGICPTPLQYFSLFHLNLDGGIMVTGSHNPPEYNGFKISIGRDTIYGEDIQKLKNIILAQDWVASGKTGKIEKYDVMADYKKHILKEFSYLNDSKYRKLKVVVDAGNGMAGFLVPQLLESIGCDVIPIYCEPDGNFPNHHPDPTVIENMQDLIAETIKAGANVGFGYDGDADRIGVVDSSGNIVWGDQLMVILSREILKQKKAAKIIADVKCSQMLFDDIRNYGGIPIMWKTGHSLIKQKMKEEGALIAGEFSGHIFIKDRYWGYDDAIYATLRLIEIMKTTESEIKELLSGIPKMFYTPEIRINCADEIKKRVVEKIVERFKQYKNNVGSLYKIVDLNTTDGVRVVFEKGWGLIRSSNTQPVMVMRVEAKDELNLNNYREFLSAVFQEAMQES